MTETRALDGVREYNEELPVDLVRSDEANGRLCIHAANEGGYNSTLVDLYDLIDWLILDSSDVLPVYLADAVARGRMNEERAKGILAVLRSAVP
jgi:hypothetical protein